MPALGLGDVGAAGVVTDETCQGVELGDDEDAWAGAEAEAVEDMAERVPQGTAGGAGVDIEVGELPAALAAGGGDGGVLGVPAWPMPTRLTPVRSTIGSSRSWRRVR